MATIGRGAAVIQMMRRAHDEGQGRPAGVGHRAPGAAPTDEDRAKAVVELGGAGFTHQRAGRITVETASRRAADDTAALARR